MKQISWRYNISWCGLRGYISWCGCISCCGRRGCISCCGRCGCISCFGRRFLLLLSLLANCPPQHILQLLQK